MKHIIFNNKKINYYAEGKGKPVILLHGFAEDAKVWEYQVKKLKQNFYLIIPDLPGSGSSEMLEGAVTIDDYAEVIKAIASAETHINKNNLFTLIGHSMGGYITLAFAEKYPQLLKATGFIHSTAFADDTAKIATRKKGIEFIQQNGGADFIKKTSLNLFSEFTKKEKPYLIKKLIDQYKKFPAASLIQYYEAMMMRPDRTAVLRSSKKPVLFIIGENDNAVSLDASLQQCHLPPISNVHILKKSGHMSMWEEKNKINNFLSDFLTRL